MSESVYKVGKELQHHICMYERDENIAMMMVTVIHGAWMMMVTAG